MIGMGHLRFTLIEFDAPGDDTALALGQNFQDVIGLGIEEDDLHFTGIVEGVYAIGKTFCAWRYVKAARHLYRRDIAIMRLRYGWPVSPVDQTGWQVPEQIDNFRP